MTPVPEILLIEDDVDDHDLFAVALRTSGINALLTWVTNAADAILRLNRMGAFSAIPLPALVVLDLGLPGLQGGTLLQVIRNAYGPRLIPVVVLTNSYRAIDRTECEQWGISDYLIKPVAYADQVRLVASLQRWLVPQESTPETNPDVPTLRTGMITQVRGDVDPAWEPDTPTIPGVRPDTVVPDVVVSPDPVTPPPALPFRLMVVEDNVDDYELLIGALTRDSIDGTIAWHQEGESAITALRETASRELPDLIISDLGMVGMSGHELLHQIRRDERLRGVPVAILTGSTDVGDRKHAAAADHYFVKPRSRLEWFVITALVKRYRTWHDQVTTDVIQEDQRLRDSVPLILHVAGRAEDCDLFAATFHRSGIAARLHQVVSPEATRDFVNSEVPTVMIIDMECGRNGLEFLAFVRSNPALRLLPIVILAGTPRFSEVRTYSGFYVIDYIVKPTTTRQMSEFISALRQWFASRLAQVTDRLQ